MDFIKELGPQALGSRLKRLVDRMGRDIAALYDELGVEFKPKWFPVLYMLGSGSEKSITEIADAIGYTHPAIIKIAREMSRKGLLISIQDRQDGRKRLLSLSEKGLDTVAALSPVWEGIRTVTHSLIATAEVDLLAAVEALEDELDKKSYYQRARERMSVNSSKNIEIINFRPELAADFASLNEQWLREDFSVEPQDRIILDDPQEQIIRTGGEILFARLDSEIVGTCALVRHGTSTFELAKMAVQPQSRRQGIGAKLALAVINRSRNLGARKLHLETNARSVAAARLYEKLGFRRVGSSPIPARFARDRILMELDLTK